MEGANCFEKATVCVCMGVGWGGILGLNFRDLGYQGLCSYFLLPATPISTPLTTPPPTIYLETVYAICLLLLMLALNLP